MPSFKYWVVIGVVATIALVANADSDPDAKADPGYGYGRRRSVATAAGYKHKYVNPYYRALPDRRDHTNQGYGRHAGYRKYNGYYGGDHHFGKNSYGSGYSHTQNHPVKHHHKHSSPAYPQKRPSYPHQKPAHQVHHPTVHPNPVPAYPKPVFHTDPVPKPPTPVYPKPQPHPLPYPKPHQMPQAQPHPVVRPPTSVYPKPQPHPVPYPEPHQVPHPQPHPVVKPPTPSYPKPQPHPDPYPEPHQVPHPQPHPVTYPEPHPMPHPDPHPFPTLEPLPIDPEEPAPNPVPEDLFPTDVISGEDSGISAFPTEIIQIPDSAPAVMPPGFFEIRKVASEDTVRPSFLAVQRTQQPIPTVVPSSEVIQSAQEHASTSVQPPQQAIPLPTAVPSSEVIQAMFFPASLIQNAAIPTGQTADVKIGDGVTDGNVLMDGFSSVDFAESTAPFPTALFQQAIVPIADSLQTNDGLLIGDSLLTDDSLLTEFVDSSAAVDRPPSGQRMMIFPISFQAVPTADTSASNEGDERVKSAVGVETPADAELLPRGFAGVILPDPVPAVPNTNKEPPLFQVVDLQ